MAFRFPLATVLRFRASVEKREDLALQMLLLEMARTRRQIEQMTAEIEGAREARSKAMQKPVVAFQIQAMDNDIETAADRKKNLLESLTALDRQREIQTRKYQAAHRDRQTLSDMSARQRDAYDQERARTEQKFLDDIFAARARRS
jgi:flagellar export protein FliJ